MFHMKVVDFIVHFIRMPAIQKTSFYRKETVFFMEYCAALCTYPQSEKYTNYTLTTESQTLELVLNVLLKAELNC